MIDSYVRNVQIHDAEPILEVRDISKNFIVKPSLFAKKEMIAAVKNVSFDLYPMESLGIIGESGCGKTTTAQMILRLLDLSEGEIRLMGKVISHISKTQMRSHRKDLQMIFQYTNAVLDPSMTLEELIAEPLRIHKIVEAKDVGGEVERIFKQVGLPYDERTKYPDQISGGQNQRVIIARALATRSKIMICDEPVSALDVSVQGQILNLLIDLQQEFQLSYIFISHDLKVIRHMCQRIAVMYKGEIVESGSTEEVLKNPQHEHTKQLINGLLVSL